MIIITWEQSDKEVGCIIFGLAFHLVQCVLRADLRLMAL